MADSASSQPEELSAAEPTPTPEPTASAEPAVDAETPPAAAPPSTQKKRGLPPLAVIIGGAFIALAIFALIINAVIRSVIAPSDPSGIPLEVTRIASDSPLVTPPAPSSDAPVAEVGDTRVSLPTPYRLDVGTMTFNVQPAPTGAASPWPEAFSPGTAAWVPGTVLNYVLGLEATPENEALLAGLRQENPILLTLSNGTRLTFRMNEQRDVAANDEEIFSQFRLQLTLVLPQEGDTWTIATADFEAAVEATPAPAGTIAPVGQAVQIGDAQVTVTAGSVRPNANVSQVGTVVYVVELSIINTGATALDPGLFSMELQDEVGNTYLLSRSASEAGINGLLTSPIQPGAEALGSAGYVIPDNLTGSSLNWIFRPTTVSETRAVFAVPYTSETVAPAEPDIYVYEAFIDAGEETLHVLADVYNDGEGSYTVTEQDITLSCNSGPVSLENTAPSLPWVIAGNDGGEMEMIFTQPDELPCVVTIYGFTFEIAE
jgi:hypothetical protein